MEISQTSTNVSYGGSAAAANAPQDNAKSAISSDFETFLKMLTVQMENQDPLNPIESSDYAVQLATFSGVEQQVQTNDLLKALQTQLGVMSMSDLAGWVGMEARAGVSAHFEMEPITVTPNPPTGATQTFMVVKNAAGSIVDRVEFQPSAETVQWAGLDEGGKLFPKGDYSFTLQSFNTQGLMSEEPMSVYAKVVEARVVSGQTILILDSGDEIPAAEVEALRQPQG
ncbi:MAG: flagellar hook capping FlgD N-terminal domain-containing protein [Pseudomonadota bacterium]|nr:flagellar hook capping FlgD N-terminal domain-containing protein [Pseudomonadota bacterium]